MSTEMAMSPENCAASAGGYGNESTSVARSLPRNCRFSVLIWLLEVSITFTSPGRRMARRARCRNRTSARRRTPSIGLYTITKRKKVNGRGAERNPPAHFLNSVFQRLARLSLRSVGRNRETLDSGAAASQFAAQGKRELIGIRACLVLVVSADDPLNQAVAHNVAFIEFDERDALHAFQNFHGLNQAASLIGQIDLSDVARNQRLGIKPKAGDEHLHLLGGGVLGLVKNNERIVESAAAHERDRRNLDDVLFQIPVHLLELEHVIQSVIQRPQVGIDLFLQRTRQEAQTLSRFNRRAGEYDAVHLFGRQSRNCHRDSKIRFARAGGTNAKDHVVAFDGVKVTALIEALRLHTPAAKR